MGGAVLRPYRGQSYVGGAVEMAPLGVFEVRGTSESFDRLTPGKLTAPDRWARVIKARFHPPRESVALTIPQQWYALVEDAFPEGTFSFSDQTGVTTATPHLVWERDRSAACIDLAGSIGAEGYFNVLGDPVLRPVPAIGEPVWTVDGGNGGVLLGGGTSTTDDAYSVIVVSPSRTDGAATFEPVEVKDLDTSSPTFVGGPFGEVRRYFSSPAITTREQALAAGAGELALSKGFASTVSISAMVNALLQEGQTIALNLPDGRQQLHVVDSFDIGMDLEDSSMALRTRSRTAADS
jgi:hypothetical protein